MSAPATIRQINVLSKLGATLRWFLEREGIDPEQCVVSIGVQSRSDSDRIRKTLVAEFDGSVMCRDPGFPEMVVTHGVPLCVMVRQESA